MNKFEVIKNAASIGLGKVGMKLSKHSPEILLVAGIGGIVGGTVLACKATLKVDSVLNEYEDKIETINEVLYDHPEQYTKEDAAKDKTVMVAKTAVELIKLYGPAVSLTVGGIVCICVSHGIMHKRNLAITAAYKAVETALSDYRKRVREQLGEERDKEFMYGANYLDAKEVKRLQKEGKDVDETPVVDDIKGNIYAKWFDERSPYFQRSHDRNMMFLTTQERYFNDRLKIHGHVFLNEVYEALGLPHTSAGAVVGWLYKDSESYVDFGIWDVQRDVARDFVNGYEKAILLDFNVQGLIYGDLDEAY